MNLTPRQIVSAASLRLMARSLAWMMFARIAVFRSTDVPDAPAIAIVGVVVVFNPELVEKLDVDTVAKLLDHEFGHFMLHLMEGR